MTSKSSKSRSTVRTSGVVKAIEAWNTRQGPVAKVAVRQSNGQFHGATNFRQRGV